ncbi:MAG TPA: copper resistance protein CopC [Rugosimonospora sp.]
MVRRSPRVLARLATVLVAGLAWAVCVPATPASAHAYLATSTPADGAVLDQAPETLILSFTEHVERSATTVDIVDGDGRHWAVTSLAVRPHDAGEGGDAADTEAPVDVVAGLPRLPANAYHISWHTLSSDDLHATSGTLVIGVRQEVAAASTVPGPGGPGLRETFLRALALTGAATLLGGTTLALALAVLARQRRAAVDRHLWTAVLRVAATGGVLAILAVPAQLLIQLSSADAAWPRLLGQQITDGRWPMRELGLAVLLGVVLHARSRPGLSAAGVSVGAVGALTACAGTALLGHPLANRPVGALVGGLHVLAAGAWAGSVLVGALALVPLLRTGSQRAAGVVTLLRAFALIALAGAATLTVTGLLLAGAQVATVDALLTTPYGVLLMAKLVLIAAAGLLGLRTARALRRTPGGVSPRRLVVEAAALTGVLVLAAAMASAAPARGPRFPTRSLATVPQVSGQAADLVDTLAVRPNRPGRNMVTITISDSRRPVPGSVTGVSVLLKGPDGTTRVHPVTRGTDGWTVAVDDIRAAGEWTMSVTVAREGLPPVTDAHRWTVAPAPGDASRVVVSPAPLRPAIDWAAALVGLTAVAAAGVYVYRRHRRHPAESPSPCSSTPASSG